MTDATCESIMSIFSQVFGGAGEYDSWGGMPLNCTFRLSRGEPITITISLAAADTDLKTMRDVLISPQLPGAEIKKDGWSFVKEDEDEEYRDYYEILGELPREDGLKPRVAVLNCTVSRPADITKADAFCNAVKDHVK